MSSKVRLRQLDFLKQNSKCNWLFCKLNDKRKCLSDSFWGWKSSSKLIKKKVIWSKVYERSKVYASCLEVLRKLATCSFWVRECKEKHRLRGCIQLWKTTNKLQRKYLEAKNRKRLMTDNYPKQLKTQKTM